MVEIVDYSSLCFDYCMMDAILAAKNSEDPKTKVGACIVKNGNIIGYGCNRAPKGFGKYMNEHNCWNSEADVMHKKNTYVLHAEVAAIMDVYKNGHDTFGSTIYVTLFPCNECAKIIIEAGIKKVCYLELYSKSDKVQATKLMFDECGIEYIQSALAKDFDKQCIIEKETSKIKMLK